MVVRPTSWGRGKTSWGPWTGLVRGIIVSFRWEIKCLVFIDFGDRDCDSVCVERRSLAM